MFLCAYVVIFLNWECSSLLILPEKSQISFRINDFRLKRFSELIHLKEGFFISTKCIFDIECSRWVRNTIAHIIHIVTHFAGDGGNTVAYMNPDGDVDRRSFGIVPWKIRLYRFGFGIQFPNRIAAFCQMTENLVESNSLYCNRINILIDILGEKAQRNRGNQSKE